MARRRNTRRRNPIKSTGMLVINPRRRNTRRKNTARRANPRRRNTRRRNPSASYKKIGGAWRSNPRRKKRTTRRRKTTARRSTARRKNTRRRNSVLALRRANGRRRNTRRKNTRRRNTRRRNGKSGLAKIPVIGPMLSSALGFFTPAALGAFAVEPTLMIAKFVGPMVPQLPSSVFYVGTGLLLAGFVSAAKFLPISAKMRKDLALAIASATGGVAYYKWRTGSDVSAAAEAGALEIQGVHGWADGLAYAVQPYSGYGAFIHGR